MREATSPRKPHGARGPGAAGQRAVSTSASGAQGYRSLELALEVLRGPGRPLDGETRAAMEPRFGHDFGGVRVHDSPLAGEAARAISARAFTLGRDIAFAPGQYAPRTPAGQRLLAHAAYYRLSPPVANFLWEHPFARSLVRRCVVGPIVAAVGAGESGWRARALTASTAASAPSDPSLPWSALR